MADDVAVDQSETFNHTGPGTEMGELLRRFWVPVLLADELPGPWCPPVRTKLLGEELVAYRDTDGRIAFLQEYCAHRRASLYFGRNESEQSPDGKPGLRCAYHGWKYDITGQCIDMPNEPPSSRFKEHVRITSYPGVERGGAIWAYLGPPELMPGLPDLEWCVVPDSHRYLSKRFEKVCFTQAMEGGIDSSHISFLHADIPYWQGAGPLLGQDQQLTTEDTAPRFFVEPTEYGLAIGARRNHPNGGYYWRITQWLMPIFQYIPRTGDGAIGGHAWVPIDDENCWAWSITYHPDRPLTKPEFDSCANGLGIHVEAVPGTSFATQRAENDYLIDRRAQAHMLSLSGIYGVGAQDQAMQESMGPRAAALSERLGSSDAAIVAMRQRLIAAARSHAAGGQPSGLDPLVQRIRSTSAVLTEGDSWMDATAEQRRAVSPYYSTV